MLALPLEITFNDVTEIAVGTRDKNVLVSVHMKLFWSAAYAKKLLPVVSKVERKICLYPASQRIPASSTSDPASAFGKLCYCRWCVFWANNNSRLTTYFY